MAGWGALAGCRTERVGPRGCYWVDSRPFLFLQAVLRKSVGTVE
jgi:hypothetical protein